MPTYLDYSGLQQVVKKLTPRLAEVDENGNQLTDHPIIKIGKDNGFYIEFKDMYNAILTKLLEQFPDLLRKEVIYEYTGEGHANFDETITLSKNLDDYDYIEVLCKTDDGYSLSQKVDVIEKVNTATFAAGNIGYGSWFFMKCKTYKFEGTKVTTEKYNGSTCAGTWYYTYDKTSGDRKAKVGNESIGISKIVGYRKMKIQ